MVEPEFTYPSHPFSPELCTEIAALPLGLNDIALGRQTFRTGHPTIVSDFENGSGEPFDKACNNGADLQRID